MSAFKLGQAAPSAIESLALASAGAAVGLTTTGVGAVPGLVGGLVAKGKAKRMVRDAVLDYAKGEANDEQAEVAQQALKLGAKVSAKSSYSNFEGYFLEFVRMEIWYKLKYTHSWFGTRKNMRQRMYHFIILTHVTKLFDGYF